MKRDSKKRTASEDRAIKRRCAAVEQMLEQFRHIRESKAQRPSRGPCRDIGDAIFDLKRGDT